MRALTISLLLLLAAGDDDMQPEQYQPPGVADTRRVLVRVPGGRRGERQYGDCVAERVSFQDPRAA